ncbi:MAG: DNA polymerase III subunit gamma/tau [Phycisphaerae bacterium]|nr:DNA polymerase III subunit gamma/tau [Phycisphaerae bacterium]
MAYTVIARRYRSQTFDDVVGQDGVGKTLKNAIQTGRVAHAYLFCGTRGVGKTTMARILAKSLNCLQSDSPTVTPCLKCDSCVSINAGEDIDVVEIDGASNRGIDNIRELRQNALYRPARSRYKIYIIDEVHMLTTEAFNALLKILEEPPAHVKFIFATTEPNKVLPTIQSRCQRFDFQSLSPEVIGRQLEKILKNENIEYEKDLVIYLSRLANGSMRDSLSLLDQLISSGTQPLSTQQLAELIGIPDRQKVLNLLNAIACHDGAATLQSLDQLISSGQSTRQICRTLIDFMRDLMVFLCAGPDNKILMLTQQEKQQLSQIAQEFDIASLIYNITTLEKLEWTIHNSESGRALLEASLLRLALSEHFIGLDQLRSAMGKDLPGGGSSGSVKKKSLTDNSPAGTSPSLFENSTPPSVAPNPESPTSFWSALIKQCGDADASLPAYLQQARAISFENSTLCIQFPRTGQGQIAKNRCESKLDILGKFASQQAQTPVRLRIEFEPDSSSQQIEKTMAQADSAPIVNRMKRQEILNDPAVQMVLQGLNATPVEIQKVDIAETDIENQLLEGAE